MNYTYIVKCKDDTLYTGWTNDLEKRVNAHNDGKGAKYTKSRKPVALVENEPEGEGKVDIRGRGRPGRKRGETRMKKGQKVIKRVMRFGNRVPKGA